MQSLCSQCGTINVPGAATCSSCGARLASLEPTQRAAPGSMYGGYGQPGQSASAPYGASYYQPGPPPYAAPPGQSMQPIYLPPVQQPLVVVAPPAQKKTSAGKVIGILLLVLGIPLLLCGLPLGGFLLFTNQIRSIAVPTVAVPPLYTSDLTADDGNWQCEPDTKCQFAADGYHILAPDNHVYFSQLNNFFDDQVIDVHSSIVQASSPDAGVAVGFRANAPGGYAFIVFADGSYELVRYDDVNGDPTHLIPRTASSAIHQGLNQPNDLKVIAKNTQITLFINGKQINQISDTSSSVYYDGNLALGAASTGTNAVFSHLTVTSP
jgi:hypothetical protein